MEDATNAVSLYVTWVINQNIVVERIDDVKEITDRLNPLVTGISSCARILQQLEPR